MKLLPLLPTCTFFSLLTLLIGTLCSINRKFSLYAFISFSVSGTCHTFLCLFVYAHAKSFHTRCSEDPEVCPYSTLFIYITVFTIIFSLLYIPLLCISAYIHVSQMPLPDWEDQDRMIEDQVYEDSVISSSSRRCSIIDEIPLS
ncbi:hypothetical protein GEMRC1_004581 [Eukaryota sp. GEM-RC1]